MSPREAPDSDARGPRRLRALLSLLFLLHWGAVCAYLAPGTRAGIEMLPGWLQGPVAEVVPRVVHNLHPVTGAYLDLTATRQHWSLFAPWPASWKSSVRVVPYFPRREGEGWLADTLVVRGAPEAPYPHVLHHRTYRILYNLGYEGFGRSYRPYFARAMCRSLRTPWGAPPEGVALEAVWTPTRIPWEERQKEPYRQRMGGFSCAEVATGAPPDDPASWRWDPYDLPHPVSVEGWPVVRPGEPDATAGEARDGPPTAGPPRDGTPDGEGSR